VTEPGPERFAAVHRLFLAAAELGAAELEAFLARECGGDDGLRREVLALLEEEHAGDKRLDRPAAAVYCDARPLARAASEP